MSLLHSMEHIFGGCSVVLLYRVDKECLSWFSSVQPNDCIGCVRIHMGVKNPLLFKASIQLYSHFLGISYCKPELTSVTRASLVPGVALALHEAHSSSVAWPNHFHDWLHQLTLPPRVRKSKSSLISTSSPTHVFLRIAFLTVVT